MSLTFLKNEMRSAADVELYRGLLASRLRESPDGASHG